MPRGYDSSQHPARKVGKDAFQQPQPYGGGAGGKEPPKKKIGTGGGAEEPRKHPQEYKKKDNYDYNKPSPKIGDPVKKDKDYPSKISPKKEPDTKGIPNDRKYPVNNDDYRYKNGWYN